MREMASLQLWSRW